MNNATLYAYFQQIQQMGGTWVMACSSVGAEARAWLETNKNRINHVIDTLNKLQDEFFEMDENGRIKTIPAPQPGMRPVTVYKKGKTKEEYQKRYKTFMEQKSMIVS